MFSQCNEKDNKIIREQYKDQPCANLLCMLKDFVFKYERISQKPFNSYWGTVKIKSGGGFLSVAANSLLSILKASGIDTSHEESVDPMRHYYEMTLGDIAAFGECLNYSLRDHYLLVHYADNIHWHNSVFGGRQDIWDIYDGLLRECRSSVIDLHDISYTCLPFPKFFNIGETQDSSLAYVQELIACEMKKRSPLIEFSEKLDGSFIQIRYIGNNELNAGFLISTSGTLYTEVAHQLLDAIDWLNKHKNYKDVAFALDNCTIIYEWIDSRDPHVVNYDKKEYGLHLIGIRDTVNGRLYTYSTVEMIAKLYGLRSTVTYPINLNIAICNMESTKAKEREGYVMRIGGNLLKLKSREYVQAMHNIENAKSFNFILHCYIDGTLDDFIASLPDGFKDSARTAARKIGSFEQIMSDRIHAEFAKIPPALNRKDAMLYINSINDRYGMIRESVRNKYLNRPVSVLFQENKSGDRKYIKESVMDNYFNFLEPK